MKTVSSFTRTCIVSLTLKSATNFFCLHTEDRVLQFPGSLGTCSANSGICYMLIVAMLAAQIEILVGRNEIIINEYMYIMGITLGKYLVHFPVMSVYENH